MDCPECDDALEVSETQPTYLCCRDCLLLFLVKQDDTLQGIAIKAPDGIDEEEFFASFTERLGFAAQDEDDEE